MTMTYQLTDEDKYILRRMAEDASYYRYDPDTECGDCATTEDGLMCMDHAEDVKKCLKYGRLVARMLGEDEREVGWP